MALIVSYFHVGFRFQLFGAAPVSLGSTEYSGCPVDVISTLWLDRAVYDPMLLILD